MRRDVFDLTCVRRSGDWRDNGPKVSCSVTRRREDASVVGVGEVEDMRIRELLNGAHGAVIDELKPRDPHYSYVDFLMDVPVSKLVPGEETYARQHVGTKYASRSTGKPITAFYSAKEDVFQIVDGHHRWAEAEAEGQPTLKAKVAIFDEQKGFGTYRLDDLIRNGWVTAKIVDAP